VPRYKCPRCGKRLRLPESAPPLADALPADHARCWSRGRSGDPVTAREMGLASWLCLAAGVFFWPLLVAGVFLREEVTRCSDCGAVRGKGRLAFEAGPGVQGDEASPSTSAAWVFGVVGAVLLLVAMLACGVVGLVLSGRGHL
jgi:hypothetical protein